MKRKKNGLRTLEKSDMTYTAPGRRDTVYVKMDSGKTVYKQKRYLLWKLIRSYNGSKIITRSFEYKLSFRQMYNFLKMHKEVVYNSDIPHSSCLN